ncbi:hypothetical protein BGZ58_007561 [Dissophora ornata]|nr:hypothetical protein BGZ58_007561 [Dissophora ornata]
MTDTLNATRYNGCQICWSKDQQILAKDEVIRAKDAVIAAKDEAIAQKDLALKTERELREQLQKQLKLVNSGMNPILFTLTALEEKDALTIYIRNVTDRTTYEMLHEAFSAFGTIRLLNVLYLKACAFVEFTTPDAYQRALAMTSVPVGDGQDSVLTEKRVRRPQQTFARRPSRDNLRANGQQQQQQGNNSTLAVPHHNVYLNSNNSSTTSVNSVDSASRDGMNNKMHGGYEDDNGKINGGWLRREDEGCDLTTTY